jgi:hypothetical protein
MFKSAGTFIALVFSRTMLQHQSSLERQFALQLQEHGACILLVFSRENISVKLAITWNMPMISLQQEHDLSTSAGTWNMHLNSLQQEHDLSTTKGTWNMPMISLQQEHDLSTSART